MKEWREIMERTQQINEREKRYEQPGKERWSLLSGWRWWADPEIRRKHHVTSSMLWHPTPQCVARVIKKNHVLNQEKFPSVKSFLEHSFLHMITFYSRYSSISWHWELFFQNRSQGLYPPIATSMFVRLSKICKSIIEMFWDEVFMVGNTV